MQSPVNSNQEPPQRASIPLWLGFVLALLVWEALPWALSLLTSHLGWTAGQPGPGNRLGLIPVILGTAGLIWGLLWHSARTPRRLDMAPAKNYLLSDGPYRFSRNPMYVSELILIFGWAIFYGSIVVLVAAMVWWTFFTFYQVPQEERIMEASIGEAYLEYKNTVPRWLGKPKR